MLLTPTFESTALADSDPQHLAASTAHLVAGDLARAQSIRNLSQLSFADS